MRSHRTVERQFCGILPVFIILIILSLRIVKPRRSGRGYNILPTFNGSSLLWNKVLACNHTANADVNAAKNILAAGLAVLACGKAAFAVSTKQEP